MGREAHLGGRGSQWAVEEKKRATNGSSHKRGTCALPCKKGDVSHKRKIGGSSSRRGPQSQATCDFEGHTIEFSTDEDDEGEDSEDDCEHTPSFSQLGFKGRESHIDRFLRGGGDEDDRKNYALKKGKKLPLANRKSIITRTIFAQLGSP